MAGSTTGSRLFRAEPLPTRTHPGPRHRISAAASWAEVHRFVALLRFVTHPPWAADAARLVEAVTDQQPTVVTGAGAAVLYDDMILTCRHLQCTTAVGPKRGSAAFRAAAFALAQWLLATHGGEALAEAVDRVRRVETGRPTREVRVWCERFCLAARSVLTQAPLRDYEAAIESFADIAAEEGWRAAALFAFVLADDRPDPHALQPLPVLRAAVEAGAVVRAEPDLAALIVDAPPGAVAEWRNHRRGDFLFHRTIVGADRLAATLAAVAERHGEPALPSLSWLFHHAADADRAPIAKALLATRQDAALDPLLPYLHRSWARAALARAEACDPAWMMRCYLGAVASGRGGPTLRVRLQAGIAKYGADTVRVWAQDLGPSALACLDRLTQAARVPLAPRENWPSALRDPPWRDPARRAVVRTVLDVAALPTPLTFDGTTGDASHGASYREARALVLPSVASLSGLIVLIEGGIAPDHPWPIPASLKPLPSAEASEEALLSWLDARLAQLDAVTTRSHSSPYEALYDGLERQPAPLALLLWRRGGPLLALDRWRSSLAIPMLRRFGDAVVPELVGLVAENPSVGFERLRDVGAGELAPVAACAVVLDRTARAPALAWLRRHRDVALVHLVPRAVGPFGPRREEAGLAIRRLRADPGGAEALAEVVERYAADHPQVREAVAEVLTFDEILLSPDRIRPLPSWFIPAMLSRPELRSGGALGDEAIAAIGEVLSFSTPDNMHAGVEMVRETCTSESLGRFASDVFAAWFAGGTPGQQVWALRTVGWLGDDASIPPLMAVFRRFIEARVLPQAAMAIEALAEIGSDAAIAQLGKIGERSGFKSMRGKARRHLEALAQARGLTREELEDRTAPDLGLDARGGLDLDFGPRQFRVTLDADLRPVVQDAGGRPLADLPKPRRSDHTGLATAAAARWRVLKSELRAAAGPATRRLETMLVTGRRVSPEIFLTSFARHAFVQNLSRRLLWGLFDDLAPDAGPRTTFRLGEAQVAVDVVGECVDLVSESGMIGLVHPLQIASPVLDAWRTAFAGRAIAQPFPQLDRAIHRLSSAERANTVLYRFQGLVVEAGWLRGMGTRGWPFDRPVEDALMWAVERDVTLRDGRRGVASLAFAPGIQVGTPRPGEGSRVLDVLGLLVPSESAGLPEFSPVSFDQLDPVTVSEIMREIDALARHGSHPVYADADPATGRAVALQ